MQCAWVNAHVDGKAGVLHRIEGVVLGASHHMALHPTGERRTEGAEMVAIFAVRQPDLLLEGELVEQRLRPLLDLCIGQRFGGCQGPKGIGSIKRWCHSGVSFSWLDRTEEVD